jgi:hypothetical protein
MGKYLKFFNEDTDYQAFKEGEEYILPNVSYAVNDNKVFFNKSDNEMDYYLSFKATDGVFNTTEGELKVKVL